MMSNEEVAKKAIALVNYLADWGVKESLSDAAVVFWSSEGVDLLPASCAVPRELRTTRSLENSALDGHAIGQAVWRSGGFSDQFVVSIYKPCYHCVRQIADTYIRNVYYLYEKACLGEPLPRDGIYTEGAGAKLHFTRLPIESDQAAQ